MRQRRGGGGLHIGPWLIFLVVIAVAGGTVYLIKQKRTADDHRREAARSFITAWVKGDRHAMYGLLDAKSKQAVSEAAFTKSYEDAYKQATVTKVIPGLAGPLTKGSVRLPVRVQTDEFGTLRGYIDIATRNEQGEGKVSWSPIMRLPGLRKGEQVKRKRGRTPTRALVLAADDTPLGDTPVGQGIAGSPPLGGKAATGLERIYNDRLAGHPSASLRFGKRIIRRVKGKAGRSVHTTIRLGLTQAAANALGNKLGGVAVIKPSDGSVLATSGLAVSAPQPPGSTFKIITLAAALTHGVATANSSYPVTTGATLSGVRLANASGEHCGGSLAKSFADSCNSVFGPLGAKVGANKLVAMAEKFGFNEKLNVPAAKTNTIAHDLKDSIAVGSAAIGQERDLATPLGMASVAGTIGNHGVRARLRIVREEKVKKNRAVSEGVAATVRQMMLGVVNGGTGTAAALPGVQVAGKTGTAELKFTGGGSSDPSNLDAWFVCFAPAQNPKVAVAVMLVGAGFGGKAAAPIARKVLQAAL